MPIQSRPTNLAWRRTAPLLLGLILLTHATAAWKPFHREAPPPDPKDRETIVRVQIYLDENHFGPGKIDGQLGEFTQKALARYNARHRQETGNWYRLLKYANKEVPEPYTTYTVRIEDLRYVGSLATEPAEQVFQDYMYYRALSEFVAERFHTDEKFLRKLNPSLSLDNLRIGTTLLVPNVTPFKIEDIPTHRGFKEEEDLSQNWAYVDTEKRIVTLYSPKNELLASFPITPGRPAMVPRGSWTVVNMITTPQFRYDKQMLEEGVRSEEYFMLPPGPNSPVGILWTGLNKSGIGLHGTASPETIGRSSSAGCIRLANWDAVRLPQYIRPGARVIIR